MKPEDNSALGKSKDSELRRSERLQRKPRPNYDCDHSSYSSEESPRGERSRPIKRPTLSRRYSDPGGSSSGAYILRGGGDAAGVAGLVCNDISNGEEAICIRAINTCDDLPLAPEAFTYIKCVQVGENITIPPNAPGCSCKGNCMDPNTCSCARLNGPDFPYVSECGGRMTKARNIVYECGPSCKCGSRCGNRISQRGIKYPLEVYKTRDKGWAVRNLEFIPCGAPVCEYVGILRRTEDIENLSQNDYIFEIDSWHTSHGIGGRERRPYHVPISSVDTENNSHAPLPTSDSERGSEILIPSIDRAQETDISISSSSESEKKSDDSVLSDDNEQQPNVPIIILSSDTEENSDGEKSEHDPVDGEKSEHDPVDGEKSEHDPEFCIDAASFGNVARFINHSCEPNLFVQSVLHTHRDVRLTRLLLFAAKDLSPMQELTYDYAYALNSVLYPDGQVKELPCYCGAANCRKRLH